MHRSPVFLFLEIPLAVPSLDNFAKSGQPKHVLTDHLELSKCIEAELTAYY